jgi:subtilase family serine protease
LTVTRSLGAILSALLCFAGAGVGAEDRIRRPVETSAYFALRDNVSPKVRLADLNNAGGLLDPATRIQGIKLVLAQTDPQRADLERFLEEQRDPASPEYQNWLTPEQYGERFGLSENDLANISSWLESRGFVIEQMARARNWISFNGTAEQIARTFRTPLRHVEINGEHHFANVTEPWIPASLAGIIGNIRGLDDFRPAPLRVKSLLHPEFNSSNGTHYLSPGDLAVIYDIQPLYNAGFDGTGQKLVIAGQTDVNLADMRAFRADFNLPARDPQLVLFGANPGANEDDQIEADLDLEWSGAVARNATIVYVYSQNVFESIQYAIDQNLAPVISMSYGGCELDGSASFRTLAQQANAQGITWMNSSGDSGAAGCDPNVPVARQGPAATFPADIPEVTAVGGTGFNDTGGPYWSPQNGTNSVSALSYIPEKAWNDTGLGSGLAAGGGGPSLVYPKPWWQTGPGVPNDQVRDVPDVSLAASGAHDGYLVYFRGQLLAVGGTSASSPSFAGIVSILNQYLAAKGAISKPGLGNINPALYNLARNTAGLFHDITAGNNIVPCAGGSKGCATGSFGYPAGPGYDLATGLGSVDAFNLVTKWTSLPPAAGTTMTLTATPAAIAASANVQLTAAVTAVSGANSPSGTVAFATAGNALGSAALTGSGSTTAATLTVKGASLAPGLNTITAGYGGASTAATTVSVTAPAAVTSILTSTAVTANPASISQSGSTVLTAAVSQATGAGAPIGSVAFGTGATSLGTANLVAGVAALTVTGARLAPGADTIVASYAGAGNFSNSSGATIVTVTPALTGTSTTATATPANLTATVKAVVGGGGGVPTGTVTFSTATGTLGTATLSNSIATLPVTAASLATGNNSIVATYSGNSTFAGSTSTPFTAGAAPPAIATSAAVTAIPAAFAQSSSTLLTAVVKAAPGNGTPNGNVSFASGNTALGTAPVNAGIAVLTVKGSSLAVGNNNITASYVATGNFTNSSALASVTVSVTAPLTVTTIVVSASPGTKASTTVLTAIVRAAGAVIPTGSVTFVLGSKLLGSSVLTASGAGGTGTLTLNNSVLTAGNNSIAVNYPGAAAFGSSTASVIVVSH